ncbi:MAG: universal stress protein [Rhizomicrobium sp.]
MRTILVPLLGVDADRTALELAHRVAVPLGAHIDGFHVRRNTVEEVASLTMGAGAISQEIWDTLDAENGRRAAAAKSNLEKFCRNSDVPMISRQSADHHGGATWCPSTGDFKAGIIAWGRMHELVVLAREAGPFGFTAGDIGEILMQSGRPLLIAPDGGTEPSCENIAIAWKSSAESAHALTAAMPLILRAKKLTILAVSEGGDNAVAKSSAEQLAAQLRWAGADPEISCADCGRREVSEAIVAGATEAGAGLLVIGAYGHSRAREFVLGGVTRDLLEACPVPLFVVH